MELRVLKYFLMVAREESITRAAERLHITQPTLSRQIAGLESEMGVSLIERGGRNISLTPEGILLRRRAEEIINLVDKTEMEVTQPGDILEGTINVAGGDLAAARDFVRLIKDFQYQHPGVHFKYYTDITPYICDYMSHGCVDVGLLVQPFDTEKFEFLPIGKPMRMGVYMKADDPLAKKKTIEPSDLQGKSLIKPFRDDINAMELCYEASEIWDNSVPIKVDLPNNAAVMVDEGLGYFLSSEGLIPFLDESRICFRPLAKEKQLIHTVLAWRRNQPFSRVTTAFISFLKEQLIK